nr:PEP-CTERM sorting domain-containing protein [Bryobacter sp.]
TLALALVLLVLMGSLAFAQPLPDDNVDSDGSPTAPVPEPASIALMGAGLAAVAYAGWKRNRKK